jgi:hypothetical protein
MIIPFDTSLMNRLSSSAVSYYSHLIAWLDISYIFVPHNFMAQNVLQQKPNTISFEHVCIFYLMDYHLSCDFVCQYLLQVRKDHVSFTLLYHVSRQLCLSYKTNEWLNC